MNITELNTWVKKVFPITGNNWKDRARLTAFFRIKLDDLKIEIGKLKHITND